jgi:acetoin utilization protein AcuB
MQAIAITVSPSDSLNIAYRLMSELFIRHLPVVIEEHKLVGVISDRDIRQAGALSEGDVIESVRMDQLHTMCVEDVMSREIHTVSPDTTLLEAAATFLEHKFDCLPVVAEDGTLVGIITVSDFVRIYAEEHDHVIF